MQTLREIWLFVWAVFNNWAGYATGGIIMATIALWYTIKHQSIPRKVLLCLAVVFFVMAVFKAWQAEHHRASTALVRLDGEIVQFNYFYSEDNKCTGFLFVVQVANTGQSPTVARGWDLAAFFPNDPISHKAVITAALPMGGKTTLSGHAGTSTYAAEDDLRVKAAFDPIPVGGMRVGHIGFGLQGTMPDKIPLGRRLELSYSDINSNTYVCHGFTVVRPEDTLNRVIKVPGLR